MPEPPGAALIRELEARHADTIARLLRDVPPAHLPRIEEEVRQHWRYSSIDMPPLNTQHDLHSVALFSFHPSGYVREEAVRRLAASTRAAALPYLLLRLTDWVPQVRKAALRAVQARVSHDSVAAFARNFALVQRARLVVEPFATPHGQAALLAELHAGDHTTARAIARLLLDGDPSPAAIEACMASNDPVIRTWVAPLAPHRLVADPAPSVRHAALRTLSRISPVEARPFLEKAVLDTSGSLRELARVLLPADYAPVYRDALHAAASPRQLVAAIAGLSETGMAADAEHAAAYLAHDAGAVRRAAVKCVIRLGGEAYAERVSLLLDDPSPGVSAAARNVLRRHARTLGSAHLRRLFAGASSPHARRNVLHLLAALSKWQSITALLEAVTEEDVAELAKAYVQRWNASYNRSQVPPLRSDLVSLTAAFAAAEPFLDEATAQDLGFVVRSFKS